MVPTQPLQLAGGALPALKELYFLTDNLSRSNCASTGRCEWPRGEVRGSLAGEGREGQAASDKRVPHGSCGRTKVIVLLDHHAQPHGGRGRMRGAMVRVSASRNQLHLHGQFGQCR